MRRLRAALRRLRVLATGRVVWAEDTGPDGHPEVEWLSWATRWSIFGVHARNWGWVRRHGGLECGCVRNPLTRRLVLIAGGCLQHCSLGPLLIAEEDEDA